MAGKALSAQQTAAKNDSLPPISHVLIRSRILLSFSEIICKISSAGSAPDSLQIYITECVVRSLRWIACCTLVRTQSSTPQIYDGSLLELCSYRLEPESNSSSSTTVYSKTTPIVPEDLLIIPVFVERCDFTFHDGDLTPSKLCKSVTEVIASLLFDAVKLAITVTSAASSTVNDNDLLLYLRNITVTGIPLIVAASMCGKMSPFATREIHSVIQRWDDKVLCMRYRVQKLRDATPTWDVSDFEYTSDNLALHLSSGDEATAKAFLHHHEVLHRDASSDAVIVRGPIVYYHYGLDDEGDKGWGCAYRSLQSMLSWFVLQGYLYGVPSIKDIQTKLASVETREAAFVGSNTWIGSVEVSLLFQHIPGLEGEFRRVEDVSSLGTTHADMLRAHFAAYGPIMLSCGLKSYTVAGTRSAAGGPQLLIMDPHYQGSGDSVTLVTKSADLEGYRGVPVAWRFIHSFPPGPAHICVAKPTT